MAFNARFLTQKSLSQIISNAVLSLEQANPSRGIFFIGDVAEELLWFRSCVKIYNAEQSGKKQENTQSILTVFDPSKNLFKVDPNHFIFKGLDYFVTRFDSRFRYKIKVSIHYKGIFKYGTKPNQRPISFDKLDDSWCFSLWKQFYQKRPVAADISIPLINMYFIVFTEMQRSLILVDRAKERVRHRGNFDENRYWKEVDHLREIIAKEKTLDLKNPKVFFAVTELVNGKPGFYFQECSYPCIHVLEPHLFEDQQAAFAWCFNNLRPENFGLISGFLKNFSRKSSSIPISIFDHDSSPQEKVQYRKTTPYVLFREFLGYVKDAWASGNSIENLENRLILLEDLVKIVNAHFLDFPEDQNPTMDGNDVATVLGFVNIETHFVTILAIQILAVVSKADSMLSIKTQDDATRVNNLLRFAIDVFSKYECKTWKYLNKKFRPGDFEHIAMQELMVYVGLTQHNWIEFKDYTEVFKRFGVYVPGFIHASLIEDYDYELEYNQYKFKQDLIMGY